jgi:hypothetical protein
MPKGQQLADSLGPADGVFVSGDELFVVFLPRLEVRRLHGFDAGDLVDAIQKGLLWKSNRHMDDQEIYMKTAKS